jgi:hypothetical protein
MSNISELSLDNLPRLVASDATAAKVLDVCLDTIKVMVARGELERVILTSKKHVNATCLTPCSLKGSNGFSGDL